MLKLLLLVYALINLGACNQTKPINSPGSVGPKNSLNNDNLPSEEVLGIPGYVIRCKEDLLNDRQREIKCGVADESGSLIDFEANIKTFEYQIDSIYSDAFTEQQRLDNFFPIGFSFDANKYPEIAVFSIYLSTRLLLKGEFIDERSPFIASNTIAVAVTESDPVLFKYLRINIDSIENSLFNDSSACLSNLTLYEKGSPLSNIVNQNGEHQVGPYRIAASSSSSFSIDYDPYHALFGNDFYWESAYDVFNNSAPFNFVTETWYQLEFIDTRPDIGALRVASHVPGYPAGECIPDSLRILGSDDGINWTEVNATQLTTPSAVDYIYIKWK